MMNGDVPAMQTPKQIAAGLSEMERRVLLDHRQGVWFSGYHEGARSTAGRSLRNAGLLKWHPDPRVTADKLTARGLAVRDIITKETDND